jgi:drug/metabolite transporter (DMT)-like permease
MTTGLRSRSASRPATASPAAVWGALSVVYVVWGSTYLAIRVMVRTMPPLLASGARFLVAAAVLALVLRLRGGRGALRVTRRGLGACALVGLLLLAGGNGLVVLGERSVPSGLAALLVAAVPLWVVLLRVATGDWPGGRTVAGVLVGFAGLAVLVLPGRSGAATLGGIALVLAASLSWSVGSFLSPRLPMPPDPLVATTWEMTCGGTVMVLLGIGTGELHGFALSQVSGEGWASFAYLVTFGSLVAFTAYVWLLGNAPISLVSTYAYVNPVVAVALGALLLGERVSGWILAGAALVVGGVGLVVSKERRRGH